MTEYELIQSLEKNFSVWPMGIEDQDEPQLTLFRKHFAVMNGLYQLQQDLAEEQLVLVIDPLAINITAMRRSLVSGSEQVSGTLPDIDADRAAQAKLAEYYLDWGHFEATGVADVEALLAGFWERFSAQDKTAQALLCLELESGACWEQIKIAYRKKAQMYHPDRGGCVQQFLQVQEAYEILKVAYNKT